MGVHWCCVWKVLALHLGHWAFYSYNQHPHLLLHLIHCPSIFFLNRDGRSYINLHWGWQKSQCGLNTRILWAPPVAIPYKPTSKHSSNGISFPLFSLPKQLVFPNHMQSKKGLTQLKTEMLCQRPRTSWTRLQRPPFPQAVCPLWGVLMVGLKGRG